jgi:Zn-dependent protease with chaperone function
VSDEAVPVPPGDVSPVAQSRQGRRGVLGLYDRILAWRCDGLPPGLGTIEWCMAGAFRMPGAATAALASAWTAVVVALWVALISAIGSVVVTIFGIAVSGHTAGILNFSSHTSGGLAFLTAIAAAAVGFAGGFAATYADSYLGALPVVAAALFVGIVLGLVIGIVATVLEPTLLRWRGYRRPSRREWELHLTDAMQTVVDNMRLRTTPRLLVMDTPVPQAWTHSRTIVLSKGLIEGLDSGELAGVIAHEMVHWQQGDAIANRMVLAFGWPVAALYSLGMFLSGARFGPKAQQGVAQQGLVPAAGGTPGTHVSAQSVVKGSTTVVAVLGWMLLWPAYLLTKFVMVPAAARDSRTAEYQADAGAAAAGLGGGLQRALERIAPWEGARTAWEAVLSATHPPMELRIEALETHDADPPEEKGTLNRTHVGVTWTVLVVLAAIAVAPFIPGYHAHLHHSGYWPW